MSLICGCASEICAVMGCQRVAAIRQQYAQNNPQGSPFQPAVGNKTYPLQPITEEDVRRIIREELARAAAEIGAQQGKGEGS